ncbi:unnamed protein product [Phaeothamnion confervicola]
MHMEQAVHAMLDEEWLLERLRTELASISEPLSRDTQVFQAKISEACEAAASSHDNAAQVAAEVEGVACEMEDLRERRAVLQAQMHRLVEQFDRQQQEQRLLRDWKHGRSSSRDGASGGADGSQTVPLPSPAAAVQLTRSTRGRRSQRDLNPPSVVRAQSEGSAATGGTAENDINFYDDLGYDFVDHADLNMLGVDYVGSGSSGGDSRGRGIMGSGGVGGAWLRLPGWLGGRRRGENRIPPRLPSLRASAAGNAAAATAAAAAAPPSPPSPPSLSLLPPPRRSPSEPAALQTLHADLSRYKAKLDAIDAALAARGAEYADGARRLARLRAEAEEAAEAKRALSSQLLQLLTEQEARIDDKLRSFAAVGFGVVTEAAGLISPTPALCSDARRI